MSPLLSRMRGGWALLALLAAAPVLADAGPRLEAAWISLPPPGARHGAAYVTVRNGMRADTLVAVATPVAEAVEMHEMRMTGGLMRMRRLAALPLAPGQVLRFAPGGHHLMLIGLRRPLQAGDTVPLRLTFRHAGTQQVPAEVRALTADEDAGGHHH